MPRSIIEDSNQLRLQLASTQAATQLNLGHLIHQADNYRGSFRGQGLEFRTDAYGVIRAQAGLWLSAYGSDPQTPAGDAVPITALLKQAEQVAETFSDAALTHQTVSLASRTGVDTLDQSQLIEDKPPLRALLTSAKTMVSGASFDTALTDAQTRQSSAGGVPHMGDALLGLAAPAGIGLIAGQSLNWTVGETLTLASGQGSNVAVAHDLRIHTGQAIGVLASAVDTSTDAASSGGAGEPSTTTTPALSLVTAQGKLEFEAQHDLAKFQSRDQLKLVSTNAQVEFAAAKTVRLATAGGASITIADGNITVQCPGTITVHAGKKSFLGPAQLSREMNSWPQTNFDDVYVICHEVTGEPLANMLVELTRNDGATMQLVTDAQGRLPKQQSQWMDQIVLRVLGKASS